MGNHVPHQHLASDFPTPSREDWLKLAAGALKGAAYEQALMFHTTDGVVLEALPEPVSTAPLPMKRRDGEPWRVLTRLDIPDPAAANAQALQDLQGGATGLALICADAPGAYGHGLHLETLEDLEALLADVVLTAIHLHIEAGKRAAHMAELLTKFAQKHVYHFGALSVSFGFDPLILQAETAEWMQRLRALGHTGAVLRADGRPHNAAGAGPAQELAAMLASAAKSPADVELALSTDQQQFISIGKLRAARRLWARAFPDAPPPALHTETSWRMMMKQDPHTNILRTAIAAFAAGAGGADSLSILPYNQALSLPDAHARRIARNIHALLLDEAHIHRAADPGAGASAIEHITEALAAQAWALFQEIEWLGGMSAVLQSGWWQAQVAESAAEQERRISTGEAPIVGTTVFVREEDTP